MRDLSKPGDFFPTKVWDDGERINLEHLGKGSAEWAITEVHVKTDGSTLNEPTFTFVLSYPNLPFSVFAQVSLKSLTPALNAALESSLEKKNGFDKA